MQSERVDDENQGADRSIIEFSKLIPEKHSILWSRLSLLASGTLARG